MADLQKQPSPKQPSTLSQPQAHMPYASVPTRLLCGLLDFFVIFFVYETFQQGYFGSWIAQNTNLLRLLLAYFILCQLAFRTTLGCLMLGLRIVDVRGQRISYKRSFIRFFALLPSLLPLFVGFFYALFHPKRQTWHDQLAGTFVIHIDED